MKRHELLDYNSLSRGMVYLRDTPVGLIEAPGKRTFIFTYLDEYRRQPNSIPIAFTLPLNGDSFVSEELPAFFDNLILEGWLLSRAEKTFHIDKKNRFALLLATGRYTIGAVKVHPIDAEGHEIPPYPIEQPKELSEAIENPYPDACPSCLMPTAAGTIHVKCRAELWGTSKAIQIALDVRDPVSSFSQTIHGGSVSGAQRKGLFRFDKKRATLVPGPARSTHILKPDGDFPELPANEHLTMAVAKALKFNIPPCALIKTHSLGLVFVIKRFDRLGDQQLLKEDAAQLLNVPSEDKYTGSNERVVKALASVGAQLDLNDFFRRLMFCYVSGNGDMHLKNWAMLENKQMNGQMHIAPCYDLLNTRLALPRESVDIGLPLNGKQRQLKGTYFRKFALDVLHVNPKFVDAVFAELPEWEATFRDFVPRSALLPTSQERYVEIVAQRIDDLKH